LDATTPSRIKTDATKSVGTPSLTVMNARRPSVTFRITVASSFMTLLLLLAGSSARSQVPPKDHSVDSHTQRIQLSAVVTGEDGRPINDLRAGDFVIQEGGTPLKIDSAEHFRAIAMQPDPDLEDHLHIFSFGAKVDADNLRPLLLNRRVILLYFDMTSLSRSELKRTVEASAQFVAHHMTAADLVSVVSFGAGFVVNSGFTNNRDVLESALASLISLQDSALVGNTTSPCAASTKYCEELSSKDVLFDTKSRDTGFRALMEITLFLIRIPGRKSLIHFTGGDPRSAGDYFGDLREITSVASASTLSIYEVDAREPFSEVSPVKSGEETPSGSQSNSPQKMRIALANLAERTGGKLFTNVSDFAPIFEQVQQDSRDYYLLLYNTPNVESDCRFPVVSLRVENIPDAQIQFRPVLAALETPPPGGVALLSGYHHCTLQGIDSWVGTIARKDGFRIDYDIGEMAGNYTDSHCVSCDWTKNEVWRKKQIVNGHEATVVFTEGDTETRVKQTINDQVVCTPGETIHKKQLIVSFPDSHANFYATIQTKDQMADMLLMIATFHLNSPID
jgi:VWFA-related protein